MAALADAGAASSNAPVIAASITAAAAIVASLTSVLFLLSRDIRERKEQAERKAGDERSELMETYASYLAALTTFATQLEERWRLRFAEVGEAEGRDSARLALIERLLWSSHNEKLAPLFRIRLQADQHQDGRGGRGSQPLDLQAASGDRKVRLLPPRLGEELGSCAE